MPTFRSVVGIGQLTMYAYELKISQKSQSHRFIVSLHFSKAFDREYIIELLGAAGVPESLFLN